MTYGFVQMRGSATGVSSLPRIPQLGREWEMLGGSCVSHSFSPGGAYYHGEAVLPETHWPGWGRSGGGGSLVNAGLGEGSVISLTRRLRLSKAQRGKDGYFPFAPHSQFQLVLLLTVKLALSGHLICC